jgi:hypothetical protein
MIRRLLQRVSLRSPQEAALAERCIVVNERDQVVGDASKQDCHRVQHDGNLILHRAFRLNLLDNKLHCIYGQQTLSLLFWGWVGGVDCRRVEIVCGLVGGDQGFGETYCLHLIPSMWRRYVPLKD